MSKLGWAALIGAGVLIYMRARNDRATGRVSGAGGKGGVKGWGDVADIFGDALRGAATDSIRGRLDELTDDAGPGTDPDDNGPSIDTEVTWLQFGQHLIDTI